MFDFGYFLNTFNALLPALPITFLLSIFSFVVGVIFGFFMALVRVYKIPFLNGFVIIFVSFFRGTPLLVQLVALYYGIPIIARSFGFMFDFSLIEAIYYALLVLSLHASAYLCEIFRGAILSVDKGQIEAAYSVGMNKTQALKRIVLPQAILNTLPNLLNFFILQVKNTSLASIITVTDLMGLADIEAARSSRFLEVYLMAALMYWGICVVLEWIFAKLESKMRKYTKALV